MTRHTIQFPGQARQAVCNSELPITHCLIGRRDEAVAHPDPELLKRADDTRGIKTLTGEEKQQVAKFRWDKAHGYYGLCALAWTESADDAELQKARFPAPEWQQNAFVVIPVKTIVYGT